MSINLLPYLSFRDNARAALEFYQSVFGGILTVSTFAEYGLSQDPAEASKIMHGQVETEHGFIVAAADTPNSMPFTPGKSVTSALSGDNDEVMHRFWNGLAEGGTITLPLAKAPWGDTFGMLTDRFGVDWMMNISPERFTAPEPPANPGDGVPGAEAPMP